MTMPTDFPDYVREIREFLQMEHSKINATAAAKNCSVSLHELEEAIGRTIALEQQQIDIIIQDCWDELEGCC
jgi:hypothetical protein